MRAAAGRGGSFTAAFYKTKRGFRTYRQTGLSDRALCRGTTPAAKARAASCPYPDWTSLEDEVARQMRKHCRGHGLEHFSARQSAADLSQLPGWKRLALGLLALGLAVGVAYGAFELTRTAREQAAAIGD